MQIKKEFVLANRTDHDYTDVVVRDSVNPGSGFRGVYPKPSSKTKRPDGTLILEWRIRLMRPHESRTFHYGIKKGGSFVPQARIVSYGHGPERTGLIERLFGGKKKQTVTVKRAMKRAAAKHVRRKPAAKKTAKSSAREKTAESNAYQELFSKIER
jgi:hypothetical protein